MALLDNKRESRSADVRGARVQLIDLVKIYGDTPAVDHVSIDIAPGEFLTLLGPSGSGKTTTLMMIAGFVTPSGGQILVNGEDIAYLPPHQRNIGVVFQSYALFPHMTVADNIAFPLRMRKYPKADIARAVAEALELVRLTGFENRKPRQLSGGQQQRVALARAMVFRPPVLLMDEPLGALDKKLREEMQVEIKRIQESTGITTVYVTHDQEEALTLSDRIVVMRNGRIEQVGTPRELYEQPVSTFVADFIGESNFIEGQCERDGSRLLLRTSDGITLSLPDGADVQPGSRVRMAIRPERIVLVTETLTDNVLDGTVEEVIYVGESTRLRVRITGEWSLSVKQQNRADAAVWKRGDRVRVGWKASDAVLVS
ncbi:ABC transporter ATP-binding protein [Sphaerobacter thermophilus]|uniref:Spermidine/putrescine import ATP-binding protein PotA n=1 Tax=Sphaerobacter thermophilus (strain ATCC 49802 / DSM 20745 / KCCM 41009 / NCIMB 13125 / S 6022) TaxID=479434 RepID=D1C890_SPHTD|nr:ABC transporter ATP-binding protein [Sphaerobacter thermophilus]ACZ40033.1 spermidine/putrescine ABC transporter ATPase subunit [Sphaerobacter thermophilus DSM 20745]